MRASVNVIVYLVVAALGACGDNVKKQADAGLGDGPSGDTGMIDSPVDTPIDAPAAACACATASTTPTKGSAIAITPDDTTLVAVNKDVGTVTVARVSYAGGQPTLSKLVELDVGGQACEPTEVAIDACGKCAYVVTRQTQKVVRIENLATTPTVGASAATGSEPTAIALSPDNDTVYVANWVDGTISVIDSQTLAVGTAIDLNAALVATGRLGTVTARPALAHPRDLAVTADGNFILATEFFAQRTAPEAALGANADTNKVGMVYKVATANNAVTTIDMPAVLDTGFVDHNNGVTGCFPNQLGAITIDGAFAWVTSTCASPRGPLGVFTGANAGGACTVATQAVDCGAVGGVCNTTTNTCNANPTDVKTTTHPAMSIVNIANNSATTTVLDKLFETAVSTRMPLSPTDVAFKANFAYVTAAGTDAAFRLTTANGTITAVGSMTNKFIDLRKPMDSTVRLPSGLAIASGMAFGFAYNEGTREIVAVDLNAQAIAGVPANNDFRTLQASALPGMGTQAEKVLRGKRFFNTGLGRWSLRGEGWGSCLACHPDGLTDNVTWYFGRGPRQSTSLDGSFATSDPTDQRIFNWTAVFDEVADFEGNTRGTSGGVGALVSTQSTPPVNSDRIATQSQTPPQQGLQGSSDEIADPAGTSAHPHSVLPDWLEIKDYMKSIRSPRAATGLVAADVTAGAALFGAGQGNCVGCHSGAKWTISKRFYTPGDIPNAATNDPAATSLSNVSWSGNLNGFPMALLPAQNANEQRMRFGNPPGAEQIQCILRPVGTFNVAPAAVGVAEVRQDMTTPAQGAAATGNGFNPPSLLGTQIGGPFFHAGNARTLEELLSEQFAGHHRSAIAQVFTPNETQIRQLVAFMLSIDESTTPIAIPAVGATGGDFCRYP